ncbi:c-type cytochrome, partial [Thiotrichales bacterium HSG1]|nr:c-type cytochrome [Thiotrichales bacterium HSG1]
RGGNFVNDTDMKLAVQYMLAKVEVETSNPASMAKTAPSPVKQMSKPPVTEIKPTVEPVATVNTEQHVGKPIYDRVCMACHNAGLLNAPKLGVQADWVTRIQKGEATLLQNSINGINSMPPRGGNFVNDTDMKLAVQYMLAKVEVETSSLAPVVKTVPTPVKEVITKPIPKTVTKPIVKVPQVAKSTPKVSEPKVSKPTSVTNSPKQGKDIYDITCKSCHMVGIAKAPRITEKKDWEARLPKGKDTMVQSAINGLNIMPPKGGNSDLTDEEVKSAVLYMLQVIEGK